MTRKHPENDNPNVQSVRELAGSGCCQSQSLFGAFLDGALAVLIFNNIQNIHFIARLSVDVDIIGTVFVALEFIGENFLCFTERNECKTTVGDVLQ